MDVSNFLRPNFASLHLRVRKDYRIGPLHYTITGPCLRMCRRPSARPVYW